MKVFLINLDKNPERLRKCDAQLRHLGVDYERFPAVYGKTLPKELKKRHVHGFLWWCAGGRRVLDGEIGCALSHIGVYRKIIAEGLDFACVLEDDVILTPYFADQLKRVEGWVDSGSPQVVLLSNHTKREPEDDGAWRISWTKGDRGAEGYVITRPAAIAMIRANYPLRAAADTWPRWVRRAGIELFHAFPVVCRQDWTPGFHSDIGNADVRNYAQFSLVGKIMFKVGRLLGKMIDEAVR